MNAQQFEKFLIDKDACEDAQIFCKGKSLKEAWDTTDRGDWMLWLMENSENKVTDKQYRLIAVKCARRVQHRMKDQRSIDALDVAERYANGQATDDELKAAWAAAWAAWEAAAWEAAAWAAAAWAAWEAAAWAAREAAEWAAWEAAEWAAVGVVAAERKAQADIIREIVPVFEL